MATQSLNKCFCPGSTYHINLLILLMQFLFALTFVTDANSIATSPSITTISGITDRISTPLRLTVDRYGYIYVCDPRGGGVLQYSNSGMFIQRIPTPADPLGIATDASNQLVVTMGGTAAFINPATFSVTPFPVPATPFKMLNGVTIDPSTGRIFITDTLDNSVKIFDSAGTQLDSFNGEGTIAGVFRQPTGIAYEKISGNLAIVDSINGRVVFFTSSKSYVKTIGSGGTGPLRFTSPQGVAFEYSGTGTTTKLERMYVLDTFQSNIQAIGFGTNDYPVFLRYLGSYPTANSYKVPGKLIVPADLALDSFNNLNRKLIVSNGFGNITLFGFSSGSSQPGIPLLTVNALPTATNLASVPVTGTADVAQVTVNGGVVPVVGGVFSTIVSLSSGANLIVVDATNGAGTTTQTFSIIRTGTSTTLTLNNYPPSLTNTNSIQLSGTVSPASTVYVNGIAISPTGTNWAYPGSYSLIEGVNDITVSAGDATLSFRTILDSQPPIITMSMAQTQTLISSNISVSGTVSDSYGITSGNVTITVTGGDAPVTYQAPVIDGMFSLPVQLQLPTTDPPPAVYPFTIEVAVQDSAGNQNTITRTFSYNPSAPIVAVDSPNWVSTRSSTFNISGTAPEGSIVTVSRLDGVTGSVLASSITVTQNGQLWRATGSLISGNNTFLVTSTLGLKSSSVVRDIIYDSTAPILSITTPQQDVGVDSADGVYIKGTVSAGVGVSALVYKDSFPLGVIPVTVTSAGTINISVGDSLRTLTGANPPPNASYQYAIIASDTTGSSSIALRNIVLDSNLPVLTYEGNTGEFTIATGNTLVVRSSSLTVATKCSLNPLDPLQTICTLTDGQNPAGVVWYDPATMNVTSVNTAGVSTRDGDINLDGVVDIRDLVVGIQVIVGILPQLGQNQMLHGDVGPMRSGIPIPDDKFAIEDLMLIMRKVVGIMW